MHQLRGCRLRLHACMRHGVASAAADAFLPVRLAGHAAPSRLIDNRHHLLVHRHLDRETITKPRNRF
uniref:Uncharacterized protein n=1 Tax=Triticum urartu TaxID=4572 RepID=A0A8R7UM82_TRIUA